MIKTAVDAIYPNTCSACGRPLLGDEHFCDYCFGMLNATDSNKICLKCGSPKKECRCATNIYVFEGCIAPFTSNETAKAAMYRFKFRRKEYNAEIFARRMALSVKQAFADVKFDGVCCVPLEKGKELRRGYNQSELLAKRIAEILELPFYKNLLYARKKKNEQHLSSLKDRFDNVKGIYYTKSRLNGKTVLLVDDIKTTGATLNECAKQLLSAGAFDVYCVTGMITARKKGK